MKLSDQIDRVKQSYQRGGISFGNVFNQSVNLPLNLGASYLNGLEIGNALGYNEKSQKDLGIIGLINSGLNNAANIIQQKRLLDEEQERLKEQKANEYLKVPRDTYRYNEYSVTPYSQSYFKHGGCKTKQGQNLLDSLKKSYKYGGTHGVWLHDYGTYTKGTDSSLNIYDSYEMINKSKSMGRSNTGLSKVINTLTNPSMISGVYKKYQNGGINSTGYTPNTFSYNNPYNIIPSNHITAEPMDSKDTLKVYPILKQGLGKPFLYKKGMKDIKNINAQGFLEIKL